ncbi:MAG: NAD-dependent epimerase/dehydratase family protein [Thermoguttaceae bacterium]
MRRLVIGCGYLGYRVARQWLSQGDEVAVVTRRRERADELRREGFRAVEADVSDRESLKGLPEAEHVLHAVGYDRAGSGSRREVIVEGLRNVLDSLSGGTERIVFVSSTGVMGGQGGGWVDEGADCRPERESGRCGLEAEELLGSDRLGRRAVVLRLAGMYGPGRLPKLADVLGGGPVSAPEGSYLNLIHVDDAVRVVRAADLRGSVPDLYLVSDGSPTGHREFYREMARQLGVAEPLFCVPEPGSRGAAAAGGNKRVSNRKMLAQLEVELEYPDFRVGLAAICREYRGAGEDGIGR